MEGLAVQYLHMVGAGERVFETLTTKLDKSTSEPEEPEEGNNMRVGPEELTTEEEWCSAQLCQLLVQKTEGPALAIVRNLNTHTAKHEDCLRGMG